MPHREYEENEAPPPGLDINVTEKIHQNGQFLIKNQIDYKIPSTENKLKRRSTILKHGSISKIITKNKSVKKSVNEKKENDDIEIIKFYKPVEL